MEDDHSGGKKDRAKETEQILTSLKFLMDQTMGTRMKQQHTMSTTWRMLRHWRYTVDPGAVSSSTICATLFSTCRTKRERTPTHPAT